MKLTDTLTGKLALLSPEQLQLVVQFINKLDSEINLDQLLYKWQYLIEHNQELEPNNPLSNNEIKLICEFLSNQNKSRPFGLAEGEFNVPDDFNNPLPDEILDLFYPE